MTLANIVSDTNISVSDDFKVVGSLEDISEGLPTLIIGYQKIKTLYPDFDITTNKISDNVYWTFRKNEKRDKYEEDLNWFIKKVYSDLINNLSYVFVDPIQYKRKTLLKIIRKIYNSDNIISYEHDNMIYIYCNKIIFGIDLKLLSFIGVDFNKIKNKIKSISAVFLEKNQILIEYKNTISFFDDKMRYLPYLYFIKNGQNSNYSLLHISRES
jgi:phosphoglycerate-specific signal transduction histidine kinase